jgi:SulP family sulfate permease
MATRPTLRGRLAGAGEEEDLTMAPAATRRRRPAFILSGILPFDATRLAPDMIAGATLAALAIPEVMGYANIAGTPVITGLYTLLLPILAFAIFGSSRHLVVGADSATAAILAAGLVGMGAATGSTEYVQLASFAALMCAGLLILARLLELGFIANFLSRSVLIGFLTGVGIQVAMGQVGGMFGVSGATGGPIEKFVETLGMIPTDTNVPTLVVSIAVLGVIVGLERVNKAIPGALIAVVGAIIASYVLDLAADGVSTLGTVPGGLPSLSLPTDVITRENVLALLPTVISMVVVILAQSAATSRAYAMRYGDSFDENVDLVGLGLANAGAAITGTFVVNGSPTKTEMVDSAGGRSQISQLTAGAIVVAVLLFLTGPLAYMPNAVLAAVVFLIGLRLVDFSGMRRVLRLRPGEFAVAATTAAVVVVLGVEQGIVLAMALSILEHIYHSYRPYDTLVVQRPDGDADLVGLETRAEALPGLLVYRFGSGLYYANASRFTEEIMDLVENAARKPRWFALASASIGDIDYSGSDTIRQVQAELASTDVTLVFSDLSPKVRRQLDEYGLTPLIGADRIFPTLRALVAAYRAETGDDTSAAPADTITASEAPVEQSEQGDADAG